MVVRRMEDGGDGLQLVEVVAGEEVAQPQQVRTGFVYTTVQLLNNRFCVQGRMSALTSQLATLTSSWRGSESAEVESLSPQDPDVPK